MCHSRRVPATVIDNPILNSPFAEPARHWLLDDNGIPTEGRRRAVARGVKLGRKPKVTPHQQKEAIVRRERGEEALAEIGHSHNGSGWTISGLCVV